MFASIFVIVVSVVLFAYWFRYTCLLILSAQSSRNYASQVATANQLNFLEARSELVKEQPETPLEALHRSLDRDYRLLTYLLRHAAFLDSGGATIEEKILKLDYRVMTLWYHLCRMLSLPLARKALLEKASIVNHLANVMGERLMAGASRG